MTLDQQQENNHPDDEAYKRAQLRVRHIRDFYSSLIRYVIVSILLLIFNLIFSPYMLWVFWVIVIWGIVLIVRAFKVFGSKDNKKGPFRPVSSLTDRFFGDEWEEKKIQELMEKEDTKE